MSGPKPAGPAPSGWSRHVDSPVDGAALLDRLTRGSLPGAFARMATEAGDRPALTLAGRTVSHAELDRCASRVGGWLAARGVRPADRVLVAGQTSQELVNAYVGVLRCGATALLVDAGSTEAELTGLIADAAPSAAFCDAAAGGRVAALDPRNRPRVLVGLEAEAPGTPAEETLTGPPIEPAGVTAPAILAYTSGTTGRPKGAPLSHANVLASIRAAMLAWGWTRDDILVHALPLSHQHGLGGLHATLLAGSHAVIERRFEPEAFCARVREVGASVIMAVPTMYERLNAWDRIAGAGLDSLRLAICGSAPLPADLARRVDEWLGQLPLERYGSTEAGLVLSNPYRGSRRPGSVGYPLPGIEVRLLGADGEEVEAGADGELVVRGPQVFSGYWNRPDATAEAFTDDGWFRSGDVARADPADGSIAITGRRKEMIISGGLNVFPREVEAALDAHEAVARSAVAGVPSERWGEEVVAFVVPHPGASLDGEAVIAHCRERLSSYKCPKRVIALRELPTSEMGKVRRDELAAFAARAGTESANPTKEE